MLRAPKAETCVQLRIEALTREPDACSRSLEAPLSWQLESVSSPLLAAPEGNSHLRALANGVMVGQTECFRHGGAKEHHKGTIRGVCHLYGVWQGCLAGDVQPNSR